MQHFLYNRNFGCNYIFRQTHFNVLGYHGKVSHSYCVMLQKILKNALIYENKPLMEQLEKCAAKIRAYLDDNNIPPGVIFAPMHTLSDIIQTVIAALVMRKPVTVVSVHHSAASLLNKQNNNSCGISIEQFNPELMGGDGGTSFSEIILSLMDNHSNLIIFPDAIPECTCRLAKKNMKTFPATFMGKNYALHSGIPTFSRLLKQPTLFYALYFNKQNELDVDILGCVPHHKINKEMPVIVGKGIATYSNEWILWHYTSFFGFNS